LENDFISNNFEGFGIPMVHQAHGTFPNYISLKDGFLSQFKPLGFLVKLHE
jgi:hypothetical protein